jgi:NADH:ubiquinone oxidoreductase subunit 6 (subunit J)
MLATAIAALQILGFVAIIYSIGVVWSIRVIYGQNKANGISHSILVVANVLFAIYLLAFAVTCIRLAEYIGT